MNFSENKAKTILHYDKLIDDSNDPVYDGIILSEYMDKWDGSAFIDALMLDNTKSVLEIGIGTGRLAVKTADKCAKLCGIDFSPKTAERARFNLARFDNVEIVLADFEEYHFGESFDVIYSSLTFMHIQDKQRCIDKIARLLKPCGRFVLSVSKSTDSCIEYDGRKIDIYPDTLNNTQKYIEASGLCITDVIESEFAYILVCDKK